MPVLLGSDSETESRPRRVLVNLMIRPSDDHLEPWSLLYNAGGPKVGGWCRHWLPGAYDVGELGPGSELSAGRSCSLRLQPAAMVTRAATAWVSMYSRRPAAVTPKKPPPGLGAAVFRSRRRRSDRRGRLYPPDLGGAPPPLPTPSHPIPPLAHQHLVVSADLTAADRGDAQQFMPTAPSSCP